MGAAAGSAQAQGEVQESALRSYESIEMSMNADLARRRTGWKQASIRRRSSAALSLADTGYNAKAPAALEASACL